MLDVAGALMVQGHPEEAGQWLAGLGRQRWAPRFWRSPGPHTRPTSRCCFQSQQCTMQAGTPSNSTKPSARGGGYVSRGRLIQITTGLGVTGDMQLPLLWRPLSSLRDPQPTSRAPALRDAAFAIVLSVRDL